MQGSRAQGPAAALPVHGFVLAGGKSSRMGYDKALLRFGGRAMVEIAVEKLRSFCADVSIAGNRDDLSTYAPVVHEQRQDVGPAAGVEAGLCAAAQPWVLFVPVDVPLVPAELLQRWVADALGKTATGLGATGLAATYLLANSVRQPAFCLFRASCCERVTEAIDAGRLRLNELVDAAGAGDGRFSWGHDAAAFLGSGMASEAEVDRWFLNVNTPQELVEAEGHATCEETLHHRDIP